MVSCDVTLSPAGAPAGAASGSPEPVVGSFVEDGLVFAVTGEGQVRLVASDPAALLVGGATAEGVSDAVSPDVGAEGGLGDSEPGADPASPDAGAGSSAPSAIALPVAVAHDGASYELASIGPHAFDGCGAAAARIPAGVSAIDPAALASATLERVEIDSANPAFASFDGALYDADRSCLLSIPGGRKGAVRIPDNTEEVSPSAFSHAAGVDAISVDAGGNAFASWDGLLYDASGATLLRVPPGVGSAAIREGCTAIAAGALAGCASLRSIQAPATVASISPDVFEEGPEAVAAPAQAPSRGEGAVGEGAASQGRLDSLVALSSVGDAEAQALPGSIAVTLPEGGDDASWRERGFVLGDDEGGGVPTAAKKETASARAGLTGFYRADGSTMTGPYQWLTHHYSDETTVDAGLTNTTDVWGVGYLSKFGRDNLGFWTITTEADSPPMNQTDYWAKSRCYMSLEKFTSGRKLTDYTLMDIAYYKYGSDSSEKHYLTSTQGTVPWTENLFVYLTPGKACKMTWDANGGTVVDATGAKVGKDTRWGGAGSKEGYAIPVPERAGYVFEGWWTEKEGGTPVWWATACATNRWHPDAAAPDRTVYAHWSESDAWLYHASDPESATGVGFLFASGDRVVRGAGGSLMPAHPTQWASLQRTEHGLAMASASQEGHSCYVSTSAYDAAKPLLSSYVTYDVAYVTVGDGEPIEPEVGWRLPAATGVRAYLTPGKACKMTWDANGGTVVDATGAKVGKDTRWGGAGSKEGYAIPVPERAGYVFEGWWTEKEGGTPVWWATACATNRWHPDAAAPDRTVYAHWSESDAWLYHASDPESATGVGFLFASGDRVVRGAGGSLMPAHPTQWASLQRTEHGLAMASASQEGHSCYVSTSAYDAAKPLLSSYVTYDVAYVTVGDGEPIEPEVGWRLPAATGVRAYLTPGKACKMTWDANGTFYDGPKESWAGEGRDVTAPTFKVDAGYRFGWYDAPDGGKLIAKGGDSITLKKERTTCYAKVEAIDYTVSFDVSSQPEDEAHPTPPLGDRTLTVEDGLVELEEPERMPGYAFVGWALASDPANTSLVRREEGAGGAAPRWLLDASKLPDCAGKEDEVQLVARWTAVIEVAAPMQVTFLYDQGLQGQDRTAWAEGGAYLANGSAVALKVVGLESQASAGARDVIQGIDWTPGAAKLLTLAAEPDGRGGDELTASQPASGSFGSDGYVDFALDDLLFEADVAPAAITVPSNGRRDVGFRLNLSATGAVIDYSKLASLGDGGGSVTSQGGMVGRPTALAQVRLTFGYA